MMTLAAILAALLAIKASKAMPKLAPAKVKARK